MLASDLVGFVGSLFLLIPAAKDQLYRFKTDQQTRKSERSPWPGVRMAIASAWRVKREGYDGWDSLLMLLGALGLFSAFFLKMVGV
jgi:hypothetical protein